MPWIHRGFGVGDLGGSAPSADACRRALRLAVGHFTRAPRRDLLRGPSDEYARIVEQARDYVMAHLKRPIAVEEMARAAFASQRTLYRAFRSVLGESPASFVRRVRLHRIRKGLAPRDEIACTVSRVAYRNGMMQLGRMARWYREVFGELPSKTLAEVQAGRARRRVMEVVREKGLAEALAP
ncbi:MAG: helix-turn-helix transcriptional regulator [Gemmatimonadota bacterium]